MCQAIWDDNMQCLMSAFNPYVCLSSMLCVHFSYSTSKCCHGSRSTHIKHKHAKVWKPNMHVGVIATLIKACHVHIETPISTWPRLIDRPNHSQHQLSKLHFNGLIKVFQRRERVSWLRACVAQTNSPRWAVLLASLVARGAALDGPISLCMASLASEWQECLGKIRKFLFCQTKGPGGMMCCSFRALLCKTTCTFAQEHVVLFKLSGSMRWLLVAGICRAVPVTSFNRKGTFCKPTAVRRWLGHTKLSIQRGRWRVDMSTYVVVWWGFHAPMPLPLVSHEPCLLSGLLCPASSAKSLEGASCEAHRAFHQQLGQVILE